MQLADRIVHVVVSHRRACLLVGLILVMVCASGLALVGIRNDYRAFFEADDRYIRTSDWLLQRQGEGLDVAVVIYRPGAGTVFQPLNLVNQIDLTALLGSLPGVIGTQGWLETPKMVFHSREGAPGRLAAPFFYGHDIGTPAGVARLQDAALALPHVAGRTVARDGSSALFRLFLDFNSQDPDRLARIGRLRDAVGTIEAELQQIDPGARLHLTGAALFDHAAFATMRADLRLLFPLALVMISLILFLFFRSVRFVVLGLCLVMLPVVSTAGLIAGLGFDFTTLAVSGLLLVGTLAVADVLHVSSSFYLARSADVPADQALRTAVRQNLVAIAATSLTTAIGQIAMLFSASPPIRVMGLVVMCGVWLALLLTLLILPSVLTACQRDRSPALLLAQSLLRQVSLWSMRRAALMCGGGLVPAALALLAIGGARVTDSLGGWFAERTDFRQSMDVLARDYAGSNATIIALRTPLKDQLAARNFPQTSADLADYRTLRDRLGAAAPDGDWFTVVDMARIQGARLKAGATPLFPPDPVLKPFTARTLAESSLMLRPGQGRTAHTLWHHEATTPSSFVQVGQAARIEAVLDQDTGGRESRIGGLGLAFAALSVSSFYGIVEGSVAAFVLVSLTLFVLLRQLRVALLSLAPNLVPIVLALGLWSVLVGQINLAAATVFSVSLGLVVDDTIHILLKYRTFKARGMATEQAVAAAIAATGTGLLATTLVIASGFFLLGLSGFLLTAQKAALVGGTITLAFLFDIILLPALLKLFDSRSTARQGPTEAHGV